MKSKLTAFLIGVVLASLSGMAAARDHVNFSISVGVPGPAFVAPAPIYYPPPQAVYYAPPAVYYGPAVYYAPRPWVVGGHYRPWHAGYRHRR